MSGKLLLAGTIAFAVAGLGSQALAADMPVKAAPRPVVAAYNWTGWYVGGHIGGGWSGIDITNVNGNAPFPAGTQNSTNQSGVLGGIQAGFNYQMNSNWVVGVEGDYSWASLKGDDTRFSVVPGFTASRLNSTHTEVDWMATVTGRVGYSVSNWLLYAKGGAAWAHKEENGTTVDPTAGNLLRTVITGDETRFGWTVGAGAEWGFAPNWSAKFEYNYLDFGTDRESRNATYLVGTGLNPLVRDTDFHIRVVKAGLNYRLNFLR
jgi:outer membrane immunogenic protein